MEDRNQDGKLVVPIEFDTCDTDRDDQNVIEFKEPKLEKTKIVNVVVKDIKKDNNKTIW